MKTLVMTGGTRGIGRRAIDILGRSRVAWRILLLARSSARAAELKTSIGSSARIEIIPTELASLQSVDAACDDVVRRLEGARIDAMALNAGIQEVRGEKASLDGLELTFAVNHLAHFVIADRLVGLVRPGGRVVITASEVHDPEAYCLLGIARAYWQDPLELADPRLSQGSFPAGVERGEARYSASKLMNVMHARLLAREAPHAGVVSFNPGVVPGTDIARERNLVQRMLWKCLLSPLAPVLPGARSLQRSASDLLWLLAEADLSRISGSYVDGRAPREGSADSRDASRIARMRTVSRKLVEVHRDACMASRRGDVYAAAAGGS